MPPSNYSVLVAAMALLTVACVLLCLCLLHQWRAKRLLRQEAESSRSFVHLLTAMHEVRNLLARETTAENLFRNAIELGVAHLGFERLSLFLYDQGDKRMRGTFGVDPQGRLRDESHISFPVGPAGSAFDSRFASLPLFVEHTAVSLWEASPDEADGSIRHRVGQGENCLAALTDGDEVLGYLAAENPRSGLPLAPAQRSLLGLYAGVLGHLLGRFTRDRRVIDFGKRLTALHEVGNRLLLAPTLDDLARQAVELGRERLGFERMGLFFYNREADHMVGTYGTDEKGCTTDERGAVAAVDISKRPNDRLALLMRERGRYSLAVDEPLLDHLGNVLTHGSKILAPLWNGEEVTGYLVVDNLLTLRRLDDADGEILCLYALQLGHLVTRRRAEEETRRFAARLEALHQVANALLKTDTTDDLCRRAVELGRERLHFDRVGLWLYDARTGLAQGTYGTDSRGVLSDERSVRREPSAGSVGARVVHDKVRYLRLTDTPLFESWTDAPIGNGQKAAAALWDGENVIGWISTDNLVRRKPIEESDAQYLSLYAATLGHLLTRRHADDEARRFNNRLTTLHETANALLKQGSFDDLCRAAVEFGRSQLGFERLGLWFYDARRGTMHGAFGTDEQGHLRDERGMRDLPVPDTAGAMVARRRNAYFYEPATTLFGASPGQPVGHGGKASAALWDGNEVIGFLATDNLLTGRPLTESDAQFLALYASTLGHLLTRKRGEEEKERLESQVRQAQKLESLGVLAGGIAHDFNNLLMGILGNADLALTDLSPVSPAHECLDEIRTASKRAADLCHQMLAYSGKGRFVIRDVDVGQVVEEMGHLLRVSISKNVVLRYKFAPSLPRVQADPTQLRQVIMNLITNASEAIGERSGVIMVATGLQHCDTAYLRESSLGHNLPEGQYVYVEVSDNGCGMTRETMEKIFEPFFTTKFTGRGLGLAAVLGIVRGHSGTIRIYSEPGEGTTFKVLFPAAAPTGAPPDEQSAPPEAASPGAGTVLVIDDDEIVRQVATRMLQRMGYAVLTAADGREGVDLFARRADDVRCVLLDLTMPRMGGEAAFAEIRALRPDVPVVMASGYNEQEVANRFGGETVPGFIQKPFQMADLAQKIQQAIDRQALGV